jgi:hypothetical protein
VLRLWTGSVPAAFSLTVDFEIDSGTSSLFVIVPVGSPNCFFLVNGAKREGKRSAGFGHVDRLLEHKNSTSVLHVPFQEHEPHTLRLDVTSRGDEAEMIAKLDGRPLTSFKGKTSRLTIMDEYKIYDGKQAPFGVGTTGAHYLIHRVELSSKPTALHE